MNLMIKKLVCYGKKEITDLFFLMIYFCKTNMNKPHAEIKGIGGGGGGGGNDV